MAGDQTANDESARVAIEGGSPEAPSSGAAGKGPQPHGKPLPSAGPHDDPSLVNPDATPGAGSLPPAGAHDDTDSTSS